jgi:hypothetical protein
MQQDATYFDKDVYTNELKNPFVDDEFIDDEDFEYLAEGDAAPYYEVDDSVLDDIDFSSIGGKSFKTSLSQLNKKYKRNRRNKLFSPRKKTAPLNKRIDVKRRATIYGKNPCENTTKKVIVPDQYGVIIKGVSDFIVEDKCPDFRGIGYYKCKKLKELVLTINNNSPIPFNFDLFNPSMPLDYLFSTSGNLNNKITVAGGVISYSDVLFNILANPTHIVNAKFTFAGPSVAAQQIEPIILKNKTIEGVQMLEPLQLSLQIDIMQVLNDIVFFDFQRGINRPFIPDGMDVLQYRVLPFNTVTLAFFYRQKSLKKFFFNEARNSSKLL